MYFNEKEEQKGKVKNKKKIMTLINKKLKEKWCKK